MSTHTITFEDIELTINGQIWTASGCFVAEYHVERAQPDCGIPRHVEVDDYCDLDAFLILSDENGEELASQHVLNDALIGKIVAEIGEDVICEEIYNAI